MKKQHYVLIAVVMVFVAAALLPGMATAGSPGG